MRRDRISVSFITTSPVLAVRAKIVSIPIKLQPVRDSDAKTK